MEGLEADDGDDAPSKPKVIGAESAVGGFVFPSRKSKIAESDFATCGTDGLACRKTKTGIGYQECRAVYRSVHRGFLGQAGSLAFARLRSRFHNLLCVYAFEEIDLVVKAL